MPEVNMLFNRFLEDKKLQNIGTAPPAPTAKPQESALEVMRRHLGIPASVKSIIIKNKEVKGNVKIEHYFLLELTQELMKLGWGTEMSKKKYLVNFAKHQLFVDGVEYTGKDKASIVNEKILAIASEVQAHRADVNY